MKVKTFLTLVLAASAFQIGRAEPLHLLLVPVEVSIKRQANVVFDVYLVNIDRRPQKAPSLALMFGTYDLDDVTGARLPRGGDWGEASTAPPPTHNLRPNGVEHRRIRMNIAAEPGDLVSVYVEIRGKPALRSHSVLLFCSTKQKKSR